MSRYLASLETIGEIAVSAASLYDVESACRDILRQLSRRGLVDYMSIKVAGVSGGPSDFLASTLDSPESDGGGSDSAIAGILKAAHDQALPDEGLFVEDVAGGPPSLSSFAQAGIKSAFLASLQGIDGTLGSVMVGFNQQQNFDDPQKSFLASLGRWTALALMVVRTASDARISREVMMENQRASMNEERIKALEVLAMGIAHNVNNALSPVTGYADMLIRSEKGLSEQARRSLKIIRESGKDIGNMVLRLDQFSRKLGSNEKMPPVSITELARDVMEMTRPYWKDMPQRNGVKVNLTADLDSEMPLIVGNDTEIRQAMTNVLINAVDAMPRGGEIKVGLSRQKDQVVFSVSDTGTGMDAESMERCLEPFFSTRKEGAGMGLAVTYGVMHRHGGEIVIESKKGRGTTVSLRFPIPGESLKAPAAKSQEGDGRHRILYVDDEPEVLEVMRQILETLEHEVEVAAGGSQGINAFAASIESGRPFDLVITDMGMPEVDGRAVAMAIKGASPDTPVIMFSGWSAQMLEEQGAAQYVDSVVSKPPTLDKVSQMIRSVMNRRK